MGLEGSWIEGWRRKEEWGFYEFAPRDWHFSGGAWDEEGKEIWPLNIYENWIWKAWEREGGREGRTRTPPTKETRSPSLLFSSLNHTLFFCFFFFFFFFSFYCCVELVFGSNCLDSRVARAVAWCLDLKPLNLSLTFDEFVADCCWCYRW